MVSKGKEVAAGGKRKRGGDDDNDKTGGGRRRNREVLQFFEDEADIDASDSDDSIFGDHDFMDEEFDIELQVKKEPPKFQNLPFVPKEEEMDEEEFDKMMEQRYKDGSGFVRYAEDAYETKRLVERDSLFPSYKDPTIWKVKCTVGRERHSAFCLMQKFVDLKSLGTKLQIISAFAIDHVKGFIYIEADKQCDINEACKGLGGIYVTRVAPVPKNEVSHLLSVKSKSNEVTAGMWSRVRNGNYKGDLAQIVAVNSERKRATVKIIPRIDLQALAQKFGGGVAIRKAVIPAPRLIISSELEEFRPLIQYRRDRDTGKMFEILDGLMLKDGYLYKKVSLDSLNCWGVMPTEEELLKFRTFENNESDSLEWLTQLYGKPKKKRICGNNKGGEKGESSSGSGMRNGFELLDLVCIGRKDFGLIVGMEKEDCYKIMKESSEGPVVVTAGKHELKNGPSDMKFTALDHRMKSISINDTVRVLEGPLKDKQGIAKQIYRGIVFVYDQDDTKNCGYFCCKAQRCEKIKLSFDACHEKDGGESGALGFEEFSSSPKSPLSPKRPWQAGENNRDFDRGDKNGMFSIGQTLRIRIGPLKGYICRVLAIRHSDVTVKLDSQQKVLTVKCEHLSEVRGKSSHLSEDPGSSSLKPFDLLGSEGTSRDWNDGAGTSTEGGGWNTGGISAERSPWPSFPSSSFTLQPERGPANPSTSVDIGLKKDAEDVAWERTTPNQNSSWGASTAASDGNVSGGWGKTLSIDDPVGTSRDSADNWGQATSKAGNSSSAAATCWDKGKDVMGNSTSWGDAATGKNQQESWGKGKGVTEAGSWENNRSSTAVENSWNNNSTGWNQQKSQDKGGNLAKDAEAQDKAIVQEDSWGRAGVKWSRGCSSGSKADWKSSPPASEKQADGWGNGRGGCALPEDATEWTKGGSSSQDGWNKSKTFGVDGGSWNKQDGESSWGKQERGSSWNKQGGSAWSKQDGGSWNNQDRYQDSGGWNKAFDMGRGSGERSGFRGGRGGRGQFGRGRSYNEGQSSDGNKKGKENNWNNDGTTSSNPSSWSNEQAGGWGKPKDGQNEFAANQSSGAQNEVANWNASSNWTSGGNKESAATEKPRGSWDQGSKWNIQKVSTGENTSSNWTSGGNKVSAATEKPSGSWDQDSKWNIQEVSTGENKTQWKSETSGEDAKQSDSGAPKASNRDHSSSWGNKVGDASNNESSGWGNKNGWGAPKSSRENSSGWNQKFTEISKESEHKGGWDSGKASDGSLAKGWDQNSSFQGQSNDTQGPSDTGRNPGSCWGKITDLSSCSSDAYGNHGNDWGKKGNWNSLSSDAGGNAEPTSGNKCNWNSGFNDGNQGSSWGKKSNWNSGSSGANQDSNLGRKSSWNSESNNSDRGKRGKWNSISSDAGRNNEDNKGNQDSGWGKKCGWNSGSSDANQGSGWGKQGNWNSGSDTGSANQDSCWDKKSNWNSGSSDANQGSGWGKQGKWNSGSDSGDANQDSGWGKKSNWNSGSSDANQGSGWAKQSNWNSESGDANQDSRFGSWSGGCGGRSGSVRGGLRGRGDRGGFGGRNGSERGGYRGRGRSDRGGFGGRGGSDRGGFGGRGGSDRGFGGRGRGGFGGRGGGRRDQGGGWNDNNDSTEGKALDWKNGADNDGGEWKRDVGSWSQGGGSKGELKSWNSGGAGTSNQAGGWSSQGSGWNQSATTKDGGSDEVGGGWNKETGSGGVWNKETDSGGEAPQKQGNHWKTLDSTGWRQPSSWNESSKEGGNKGSRGEDGGWGSQKSGESGSWNQASGGGGGGEGQSSGWNKSKEAKTGTNASEGASDSWGKALTSSWGSKGNGGGSKGGW